VLSALDADKVSTLGVLLIVGLLVVGLVVAVLARPVAVKVLGVAVLLGLGVLVWTRWSDLEDCVDRVKGDAGTTTGTPGRCQFLGLKVDVNPP